MQEHDPSQVATCVAVEEAGGCNPGLLREDVACWPFPALWLPAGNEGEEPFAVALFGSDLAAATVCLPKMLYAHAM